MSYILDALKKSEEERYRGQIPSLHDRHEEKNAISDGIGERRGRLLRAAGLLALLAAFAGVWQWLSADRQPVAEIAGPAEADAPPVDRQPEPEAVAVEGIPDDDAGPADQAETGKEPADSEDVRLVARPAEEPGDAVVIQPAPLEEPGLPVPRPALPEPAVVESSSLPLLAELPVTQRGAIPPISIEGHVYAENAARRMVMINKRVLREGEMAGNGIKLLRITWDGVVLRHGDAEFQVKIE
jgi:general secretion pathway protein B